MRRDESIHNMIPTWYFNQCHSEFEFNKVLHLTGHIVGHLQAIHCSSTDNRKQINKITLAPVTQK